jgi:hypothetical protein
MLKVTVNPPYQGGTRRIMGIVSVYFGSALWSVRKAWRKPEFRSLPIQAFIRLSTLLVSSVYMVRTARVKEDGTGLAPGGSLSEAGEMTDQKAENNRMRSVERPLTAKKRERKKSQAERSE